MSTAEFFREEFMKRAKAEGYLCDICAEIIDRNKPGHSRLCPACTIELLEKPATSKPINLISLREAVGRAYL